MRVRVPRPIRRLYYAHETLAKASGVVICLIVVVLLYVAVFRSGPDTGIAETPTPTPAPSATATATATATALPQTPGITPTAAPPFPPGRYQVATQPNVAYGPVADSAERLDLCSPVGASGLRPGLVLIHSGGFVSGDKQEYDPLCTAYASYGFVVAAVNYRLAPQNLWPAPLVDVQLAVRWLRANASQHQMDPRRLCALGDSVGANLAVFLGVLTTNHPGDKAALFADESPQVSCVVDAFGPVDMTTLTTVPDWQGLFPLFFGQANQDSPFLLRDASPIFDVSPQSAPTFIIQGTDDTFDPPSQSKALQSKLLADNVPVSYISYQGGDGFSGLNANQIEAIDLQVLSFLTDEEHP